MSRSKMGRPRCARISTPSHRYNAPCRAERICTRWHCTAGNNASRRLAMPARPPIHGWASGGLAHNRNQQRLVAYSGLQRSGDRVSPTVANQAARRLGLPSTLFLGAIRSTMLHWRASSGALTMVSVPGSHHEHAQHSGFLRTTVFSCKQRAALQTSERPWG